MLIISSRGCADIVREYINDNKLMDIGVAPQPAVKAENPRATAHLVKLFSLDVLLHELQTYCSSRGGTDKFQNPGDGVKKFLRDIGSFNARQNALGEFDNSDESILLSDTNETSAMNMAFSRAVAAAEIIPRVSDLGYTLDILTSALRWQECRSLLILQDFVFNLLPNITRVLFHAHKNAPTDLEKYHPMYFHLVKAIANYTEDTRVVRKQKENHNQRKGKAKEKAKELELRPIRSTVPGDLFGLATSFGIRVSPSSTIHLPKIPGGKSIEEFYEHSQVCFQNTIIRHLLAPYARDAHSAAEPHVKLDLFNRCLLRGLILQCIAEEVGSESIFAASRIRDFLKDPILIFPRGGSATSKYIKTLLADPERRHLQTLRDWLKANVTSEIRQAADDLAKIVYHGYAEYQLGRRMSEEEAAGELPEQILTTIPSSRSSRNTSKNFGTPVPFTRQSILHNDAQPHYGILAMILRESFNYYDQKAPANDQLRNFLQGKRDHDGRPLTNNDCDRADPVRSKNVGAELLKKKIPPAKLTKRTGFSNLLAYVGTGQGNVTRSFLATSDPQPGSTEDKFFKESLTECVELFTAACYQNQLELNAAGFPESDLGGTSPPGFQGRWLHISNTRIYGTPIPLMKITPATNKGTIEPVKAFITVKFQPYWTDNIQFEWATYLGDMLDQDPAVYGGPKKRWNDTITWLRSLQISGFIDGLTALQLVNNLVLAGICMQPSLDEMAEWISNHSQLGAFSGLQCLGFHLQNRDVVRIALGLVYDHLDSHLTKRFKDILDFDTFGVLAVEHMLCKVSRWLKEVRSLQNWVKQAEEAEKGGNLTSDPSSPLHFPIPLHQSFEKIDSVLEAWNQKVSGYILHGYLSLTLNIFHLARSSVR